MTLKVIGAGFGRTGTLSTMHALEALGFGPCHHMHKIREKPELVDDWLVAVKEPNMDWGKVFRGFSSQMDWPGSAYWQELSEYFPKAKVILTIRDPESWFDSISQTIVPSTLIGRQLNDDPISRSISEMIYQTVYLGLFNSRLKDREYALRLYREHIEMVQKTISSDRLLMFDVSDGWEPICNFLEVDIPDALFPKTNSMKEFIEAKAYLPGEE